jgi:hypothetical protein
MAHLGYTRYDSPSIHPFLYLYERTFSLVVLVNPCRPHAWLLSMSSVMPLGSLLYVSKLDSATYIILSRYSSNEHYSCWALTLSVYTPLVLSPWLLPRPRVSPDILPGYPVVHMLTPGVHSHPYARHVVKAHVNVKRMEGPVSKLYSTDEVGESMRIVLPGFGML